MPINSQVPTRAVNISSSPSEQVNYCSPALLLEIKLTFEQTYQTGKNNHNSLIFTIRENILFTYLPYGRHFAALRFANRKTPEETNTRNKYTPPGETMGSNTHHKGKNLQFTYSPIGQIFPFTCLPQQGTFSILCTHHQAKHFTIHLISARLTLCSSYTLHQTMIMQFTSPVEEHFTFPPFTDHVIATREIFRSSPTRPQRKHFAVHLLTTRETFYSSPTLQQRKYSAVHLSAKREIVDSSPTRH